MKGTRQFAWKSRKGDGWFKTQIKRYETFLTKRNGFAVEIVPFMQYFPEGKLLVDCPNQIRDCFENDGLYAQEKLAKEGK